jgi:tetratricopeptide (TPR) repeat protein
VLVTDLARDSVLADPRVALAAKQRVEIEGSSEDLTFAGEMQLRVEAGRVRIEMGALYAAALPRAMRGRLRHGRPYTLRGRTNALVLKPGDHAAHAFVGDVLELTLGPELASEIEARLRGGLAGRYRFEMWPALEIVVTPSVIRDQNGKAIEVRGIADRAEAQRLIAEENARLAAEQGDDEPEQDRVGDDQDDADDEELPSPERVRAALALTERALRFAPAADDIQFTHAMLLIDADRVGIAGKLDELVHALPSYTAANRIHIAIRVGKQVHPRFAELFDVALAEPLPDRPDASVPSAGSSRVDTYDDVGEELFGELGEVVLVRAPDRLTRLVPLLPRRVNLLSSLACQAIQAGRRDDALALYERLLELPIPAAGDERTNYLRAMNNACVQAHAAKAYEAAVRIADRAQPVAHENPYIYHSAACAYAAVGDYAKAFEQVKLAVEHDYDHLGKVEVDSDLGPLLEWPEFKALFRDWHARQEGN